MSPHTHFFHEVLFLQTLDSEPLSWITGPFVGFIYVSVVHISSQVNMFYTEQSTSGVRYQDFLMYLSVIFNVSKMTWKMFCAFLQLFCFCFSLLCCLHMTPFSSEQEPGQLHWIIAFDGDVWHFKCHHDLYYRNIIIINDTRGGEY